MADLPAQSSSAKSQIFNSRVFYLDTINGVGHLTVDPHTDATGTETKTAGLEELSLLPGYFVYTPQQCVGKKRSPLVLLLHGGGRSGADEVVKFQTLADKHGMIVLAASSLQRGRWDIIAAMMSKNATFTKDGNLYKVSGYRERDGGRIDSALKHVLRTRAIDPERIALVGFSDGGSYSFFLGLNNQNVFSRIAPLSGLMPFTGTGPRNLKTQMFLSGGLREGAMTKQTLERAVNLRKEGRLVRTQIGLRGHVDYVEDEDFVWQWLKDSWADPMITSRGLKPRNVDVVLSDDIVQRVKTFWAALSAEPTAIRHVARMKNQIQVPLTIGSEETTVVMMDIPAMVAAHPTLATPLKDAGVTAEQMMEYRIALVQAAVAYGAGMTVTPDTSSGTGKNLFNSIDPASALGKNLQFYKANPQHVEALERLGLFTLQ